MILLVGYPIAMASPTSIQYLPQRLESLGVSPPPKKKRIIKASPVVRSKTSFRVVANLQDLPDDLLSHALAFLAPDAGRPLHVDCGLVVASNVSKNLRALALGNSIWFGICVQRWKTKVGFATRLANAETEAMNDAAHTANALIRGSYWYRKYYAEERNALRTTMTRDELHNTTFSMKSWFQSKLAPEMKRIEGVLASGLDGRSLADVMRFDPSSGTILGVPGSCGTPYFINHAGSIVNIRQSFDNGTHPLFSLHVFRRNDWGWELRSQGYAVRSVDDRCADELWEDYASSLIIETREKGVECAGFRGSVRYKRREVPDIEEIKEFLKW